MTLPRFLAGPVGLAGCWNFSCDETAATDMSKNLTRWSHRLGKRGKRLAHDLSRLSDSYQTQPIRRAAPPAMASVVKGPINRSFSATAVPPLTGFTLTEKWQAADTLGKLQTSTTPMASICPSARPTTSG